MDGHATDPQEVKNAKMLAIAFFDDFEHTVGFLTEKNQCSYQGHKERFIRGIEGDVDENRLGFRRR